MERIIYYVPIIHTNHLSACSEKCAATVMCARHRGRNRAPPRMRAFDLSALIASLSMNPLNDILIVDERSRAESKEDVFTTSL